MASHIRNSRSEPKRVYLRRVKDESSLFKEHITQAFTDPNIYFSTNLNGHKILFGKRSNKPPKLIKSNMRKSIPLRQSRASINTSKGMINSSNTQQSFSTLPPHKYYIEDRELRGIFDNMRLKQQRNMDKTETLASKLRIEDRIVLNQQNKALSNHNIFNKTSKQLSEIIAKRVQRPNEKSLMATSTDFRIKTEMKDNFNDEAMLTAPKSNHYWISTLRNDNGDKYVNIGTAINPNWQLIVNVKGKREIIRNPSRENNNKRSDDNSQNMSKTASAQEKKHAISHSINFKDLEVIGRDLLQCEFDIIKRFKGKKVITKYPSKLDLDSNGLDIDVIPNNKSKFPLLRIA